MIHTVNDDVFHRRRQICFYRSSTNVRSLRKKKKKQQQAERTERPTVLRIRHIRLDPWDPGPRVDNEDARDLPDIPARLRASTTESGSRPPFAEASRIPPFDPRRRSADEPAQSGGRLPPSPPPPVSFDGWNKKMGGALNAPGPDLSPGRGRRGRTLEIPEIGLPSLSLPPCRLSVPLTFSARPTTRPASIARPNGGWEGEGAGRGGREGGDSGRDNERGEWMKTANHRCSLRGDSRREYQEIPRYGSGQRQPCCCWRCCRHRLRWSSNKVMGLARTRLSLLGREHLGD